jgi:hypothetical protein
MHGIHGCSPFAALQAETRARFWHSLQLVPASLCFVGSLAEEIQKKACIG